jgi:dihydroxyacetone kinase-like predicted kinase
MRWQQEEIMEKDEGEPTPLEKAKEAEKPALDTAVIAVASGDGIAKLLESLGVTHVINGGQTMNPSIQEIAEAINESGAKQALVLPDNGNIFMAADQAAEVADIPTKVVHAKTIAQGMSAMLEFNPEADLAENQANMEGNLDMVKSGEVTNAVRDTTIDGQTIKKDDFMGIVDGKIVNTAGRCQNGSNRNGLSRCWMKTARSLRFFMGSMAIKKLLKPSRKPFWPLMTN